MSEQDDLRQQIAALVKETAILRKGLKDIAASNFGPNGHIARATLELADSVRIKGEAT